MRAAEFSRATFYFSDQNGHGGPDSHAKEDLIPATKNAPFCGSAAATLPPGDKGNIRQSMEGLGYKVLHYVSS